MCIILCLHLMNSTGLFPQISFSLRYDRCLNIWKAYQSLPTITQRFQWTIEQSREASNSPAGSTMSGMRAKGMLSPRAGVYAARTVTCPATCTCNPFRMRDCIGLCCSMLSKSAVPSLRSLPVLSTYYGGFEWSIEVAMEWVCMSEK